MKNFDDPMSVASGSWVKLAKVLDEEMGKFWKVPEGLPQLLDPHGDLEEESAVVERSAEICTPFYNVENYETWKEVFIEGRYPRGEDEDFASLDGDEVVNLIRSNATWGDVTSFRGIDRVFERFVDDIDERMADEIGRRWDEDCDDCVRVLDPERSDPDVDAYFSSALPAEILDNWDVMSTESRWKLVETYDAQKWTYEDAAQLVWEDELHDLRNGAGYVMRMGDFAKSPKDFEHVLETGLRISRIEYARRVDALRKCVRHRTALDWLLTSSLVNDVTRPENVARALNDARHAAYKHERRMIENALHDCKVCCRIAERLKAFRDVVLVASGS